LRFCLRFKIIDPGFICCNNPGYEGPSFRLKTCQQLGTNGLSVGFMFDCDAPRNPPRTHLRIFNISNGVTNSSFADWKTQCHLSCCDASILANDGISTLQQLRTNSCDTTPCAR
jgi:hypothetical protein